LETGPQRPNGGMTMKQITLVAAVLAAAAFATPASADQRGHGRHDTRPVVDLSAQLLSKKRIVDVDATVRGVADLDLDISKRKGVDLDLSLGGKRRNHGGADYDFGGGVGG